MFFLIPAQMTSLSKCLILPGAIEQISVATGIDLVNKKKEGELPYDYCQIAFACKVKPEVL